jgi:hypothetical protein
MRPSRFRFIGKQVTGVALGTLFTIATASSQTSRAALPRTMLVLPQVSNFSTTPFVLAQESKESRTLVPTTVPFRVWSQS